MTVLFVCSPHGIDCALHVVCEVLKYSGQQEMKKNLKKNLKLKKNVWKVNFAICQKWIVQWSTLFMHTLNWLNFKPTDD